MQVGVDALNAAPLNGSADGGSPPVPQPIPTGVAFTWRDQVLVSGMDVSAAVSGEVEVDRERGAAGIADFNLFMATDPDPLEWVGREVVINYISTEAGVTKSARLLTGRIEVTSWNPLTRLLACACSDQMQQRVERLSVAEVNALTPCYWSADVFEPAAGRSRWEYAEERLSTLRASLDCSAYGSLRLTTWYAGPVDYTFGPDTTVYQSVAVTYADLGELTNVVEIEADYRFSRLREMRVGYGWVHPEMEGVVGIPGFCNWRQESSELPDREMIRSAVESSGQTVVSGSYQMLPTSDTDPCGNGVPWINVYAELVLAANVTGARRWVQPVTDSYTLRVEAPASIADVGEVIARDGSAVEVESTVAEDWESSLGDGGASGMPDVDELLDLIDEPRRDLFMRCLLNQAATTIVKAHNATLISWNAPTSLVMGLDLGHTLQLGDQGVGAIGRCCRLQHRLNKESGEAMTTITIAVMQGGGTVNDALVPPPVPADADDGDDDDGLPPVVGTLPTQLGGKDTSGAYDDDRDGFSGNYDNFDPTYERFPRRFAVTAPEISAELRDELVRSAGGLYRIAIPNDLLEL